MHGNTKILGRVSFLGYCCPKEFFRAHATFTNEELSNLLGLQPRTIRFWKAKSRSIPACKACTDV
jgi:hypothetical protein